VLTRRSAGRFVREEQPSEKRFAHDDADL
jgi:hypothetical protein